MGRAELVHGANHRLGAGSMKAFERADGSEHDRQAQLAPELGDGGIDLADVAQHPRPEGDGVERHAVAPQRGLRFGAPDDIVPIVLVQVLPRLGDDLMQVEKVAGRSRDIVGGHCLGVAFLHERPNRLTGGTGVLLAS